MLRVCGVTFDHTVNYGSCLQAYALKTVIESITVQGDSCNYRLIPINKMTDKSRKQGNVFYRMMLFPVRESYVSQFRKFEKSKMHYADCKSLSELSNLNGITDVFICGSDVIWNPDQNHGIGAYYLDFSNKYKFSYAASFGKAGNDRNTSAKAKVWISELNEISCRERSSAETVKNLTGRDASVVLDPVVLLETERWNEIISRKASINKYIFSYTTHLFPVYESFLQKLSKVTGLPIIRAAYKPKNGLKQGILIPQSPQRWLQQLRDAEFVVTNSFHATAFSVLFHKKFFTVVQGDKAGGINVRMNDFLTELNLQDRIHASVPETIDSTEIDFTQADTILEGQRAESLAFLKRNLEAAYQEKLKLEQKG